MEAARSDPVCALEVSVFNFGENKKLSDFSRSGSHPRVRTHDHSDGEVARSFGLAPSEILAKLGGRSDIRPSPHFDRD